MTNEFDLMTDRFRAEVDAGVKALRDGFRIAIRKFDGGIQIAHDGIELRISSLAARAVMEVAETNGFSIVAAIKRAAVFRLKEKTKSVSDGKPGHTLPRKLNKAEEKTFDWSDFEPLPGEAYDDRDDNQARMRAVYHETVKRYIEQISREG